VIDSRSIGESFQRRVGSFSRCRNRFCCSRVAHREPVLAQQDPVLHQHPLEDRALAEEELVLLLGAEAHDVLDTGAVVPAAVEQHDLPGRGQMLDVPLEVPLGALALGRLGQRHDPRDARVEVLRDPFDRAALARRVPALEDHHEPGALGPHPLLQLHQLRLQTQQLLLVRRARHLRRLLVGHAASSAR
jgi:hypothetical protein